MTGFVYAIAAGESVKIGWSADPQRRFNKIAADNGCECTLLGYIPASRSDERAIHASLAAHRLRGEWFRRSPETEAFIATLPLRTVIKNRCKLDRLPPSPFLAYLKAHEMSVEEFAKLVGVQKSAVSKWMRGRGPSIESAKIIEERTNGELPKEALRPDVWGERPFDGRGAAA